MSQNVWATIMPFGPVILIFYWPKNFFSCQPKAGPHFRHCPVTSTAIYPVKMSIGHKSLTDLRSEMIFLQEKPVFYTFLPSTPPY